MFFALCVVRQYNSLKQMRSSQIKWLDMKTERIALSSSIGLTAIALLIKQWGNSSFASRYIDMLSVCKDQCEVS